MSALPFPLGRFQAEGGEHTNYIIGIPLLTQLEVVGHPIEYMIPCFAQCVTCTNAFRTVLWKIHHLMESWLLMPLLGTGM